MCDIRYNGPYLKPHYSTLLINTKKKKKENEYLEDILSLGYKPSSDVDGERTHM